MSDTSFKPILYIKKGCPFCFKVRLFALEAGILDTFEEREFTPGSAEEQAIRAELGAVLEKVSFPAAQLSPGRYVTESDELVAGFAASSGHDPETMPVYRTYAADLLPTMMTLYRENQALKSAR